jgi:hypothetical protein
VTVTSERTKFKVRRVAFIGEVTVERPDAVRVRSPRVWLFREPTALFFRGLLYILVGRLKAYSLAFFDILVSTLS